MIDMNSQLVYWLPECEIYTGLEAPEVDLRHLWKSTEDHSNHHPFHRHSTHRNNAHPDQPLEPVCLSNNAPN